MDNLWKKETAQGEYVDLFASVKDFPFDMYLELVKMKQTRNDNQRSTEWRLKGNELFRQEDWIEAIKCYNQSLCFAEAGSENVALAYSNRSACLFHLGLFNKVLIDIELAKNAKLPDRLIPKLEQRKSESLLMVQHIVELEPKLDYKANKHFPCMANVLEIRYNEEFGRHLVAKCDIPVGKIVLLEKDIPRIRDGELYCYTCFRVHTNCVACPNCPDVTFCCFDCFNSNETHKWECGTFFPHLERDIRFQLKTLFLAINSFCNVDSLMQFVEEALRESPDALPTSLKDSKTMYHFFFKLKTSAPYIFGLTKARNVYKAAMNLPKVGGLFDSDRKQRFLMHLVMYHILIYNTNAFAADDSKFVANVSSLLNHSCAPNIIGCVYSSYTFNVTGRPIRKGEQLFVRYSILDDVPSNVRKVLLKSRWGFECKCEKCEPMRAPIDRKLIISDPCYKHVDKTQHIDFSNNEIEFAVFQKNCIEFLNKYGRSQWSPEIEFVFSAYGRNFPNVFN